MAFYFFDTSALIKYYHHVLARALREGKVLYERR